MPTTTRSKATARSRADGRRSEHAVTRYARAVALAGRCVAGPYVRAACDRHLRDLGREDLDFDTVAADKALDFFPTLLRLTGEGQFAGQPFVLQPWQQFIVGSLFGWFGADGLRRFQHAYVECGKGAGKTPLLAGILLYGLMFDDEARAQIVCAARAREQARLMFDDCIRMARQSVLAPRLDILKHNIADLSTGSWIRPVSAEAQTLEGKRIHMAGIDEIWTHPNPDVVNALRKGTKARRQPMILEITNAGWDRTSVCWDHHEYSIKVARGVIENDAWFAYVCGLDEGDDPFADEACWVKANPNLEISLPIKYLRAEVDRARGMPSETGELLRKNFCVWTQQQTRYIPIDRWMACGGARIEDAALAGLPAWGGLDLGQSSDFSAFVAIWRLDDGRIAVRCRFWLPEAALHAHPDRPYEQWVREGAIIVTEGEATDYDRVEEDVRSFCRTWGLRDVGYDRRFAEQMAQHLVAHGIEMINVGQGYELNEALAYLLDLITTGRVIHEGHPVLTWMADNLVVRHGLKGEVRPDKPSGRDKIDGIVALAMALHRLIHTPSPGSIYDDRVRRGEVPLVVL
jgi:phage terminase large subunit-like protein